MKNFRLALTAIALAIALPAAAVDRLEVSGSPLTQNLVAHHLEAIEASTGVELDVSAVGCAKAMLDLIDGKVGVAAVSMSLPQALAAAREQAFGEGRLLLAPPGLAFHEVGAGERGLAFVTVGAPSPELQKVLTYLRSEEARGLIQAGL